MTNKKPVRIKQFSKTRQLKAEVAQLTEQLEMTTEIQFEILSWLKSNLTEELAVEFRNKLGEWMETYEVPDNK